MKTAYFIMLHHKLDQFRWLFEAIHTSDDVFCIHVDSKSGDLFERQVRQYIGQRPNVTFLPRMAVRWGGWSLVAVQLAAHRHLLSVDKDWKYLVNLSGQDYPVRSLDAIKAGLEAAWPRNFIRVWTFDEVRALEPDDVHLKQHFAIEALGRQWTTRLRLPFPTSIDIGFKGATWHMLTREFCQWVTETPLNRRIASYLRHTILPDEIFFQALIMNSPFRDERTADCGRFVLWPGPKVLRAEDFDAIASARECFFGRKFDPGVDAGILARLASMHGHAMPEVAAVAAPVMTG